MQALCTALSLGGLVKSECVVQQKKAARPIQKKYAHAKWFVWDCTMPHARKHCAQSAVAWCQCSGYSKDPGARKGNAECSSAMQNTRRNEMQAHAEAGLFGL